MSELDPKGMRAAVVAFRGKQGTWEDAIEAAITAYLSTVSPLSDGDGWSDDMSTAPKDGTRLLLWACSHHVFTGAYETSDEPDDELDGWWDDGGGWWEPHHWRSLPAPPRDEVA